MIIEISRPLKNILYAFFKIVNNSGTFIARIAYELESDVKP